MNKSFKAHLESQYSNISQNALDEIIDMYANEAGNLLDGLSRIESSEIRKIALDALRTYHETMNTNNTTFPKVATILSHQFQGPSNDDSYSESKITA